MSLSRLALAVAVAVVVSTPAIGRAGDGVGLLRFAPAGTEIVAVVDVAGARRKPIIKTWMGKAQAEGWTQHLAAAGIDLLRDIDTVLIAAAVGDDQPFKVAIIEGRFGPDTARRLGEGRREVKHGKLSYWADVDNAVVVIGKRLVVAPPALMPAAIDRLQGRGTAATRLGKAAPLRSVVAATDTRHHLWIAASLDSDLRQKATELGVDARGLIVGASFGADLRLEIRLLLADEASAETSAEQLRAALPQIATGLAPLGLSTAMSTLSVDREGVAVRLTAALTPAELEAVHGLLGAFGAAAAAGAGGP